MLYSAAPPNTERHLSAFGDASDRWCCGPKNAADKGAQKGKRARWVPRLAESLVGSLVARRPLLYSRKTEKPRLKLGQLQHACKPCAAYVQVLCSKLAGSVQHICSLRAAYLQALCNRCAGPVQHICRPCATYL